MSGETPAAHFETCDGCEECNAMMENGWTFCEDCHAPGNWFNSLPPGIAICDACLVKRQQAA